MPKIRVKSWDYGEKVTTVDENDLILIKQLINYMNKNHGIELEEYKLIYKINEGNSFVLSEGEEQFIKSLLPESYGYSSVDTISILPDEERIIYRQSDFFK